MKRLAACLFFVGSTTLACTSGAARTGSVPAATVEPSTEPAEAAASPATRRVDPRAGGLAVGFGEWAVTPEAPRIRPGAVTFVVRNSGALTHQFEIESDDEGEDHSGPGRGGGDRFEVEAAPFVPGETVRVPVTLEPGQYELYCTIANHDDLGMEAVLRVEAGAPLVKQASAKRDAVAIEGFAFGPERLSVRAGTEVVWTNEDPTEHTVTAVDGSFDSETLVAGEAYRRRFDTTGTFHYACAIHPAMEGIVEVT